MKSVYLLFLMIVGMALTAYGQDQSGFISLHDRDSDSGEFSEKFDLSTGKSRRIKLKQPLDERVSDPVIGGYIGNGVNLTGRYMDMLWTTHRSGRLVVRSVSGLVERQIKVTIPWN